MSLRVLRILCAAMASMLVVVTAAHSDTNPRRFDPLLKTNWFGLYMQGTKIGYVKMSLEKIEKPVDGWQLQSLLNITLRTGDQSITMNTEDTKIYKAPGGELYSSSFDLSGRTGGMTVEGRTEGDSFVVKSNIGGQATTKSFAKPFDFLDSVMAVELRAASGRLAVGDSFTISSFEATPPLSALLHQKAKVESKETYIFNGVPTDAFAVGITMTEMDIATRVIVDLQGNTLEGSLGGQMTIKLEGKAQAKRHDDTYDIITNNLILPDKKIVDPRKLRELKLRITGINVGDVIPTGMQKATLDSSGVLVDILRQSAPPNAPPLGRVPDEAKSYLASEPLEQSDDPRIIELARTIVGSETNSWEAAKKINAWVYENIEKRFTPDFSNALQTLNSGEGDCGEHAALSVALMRAAGIPARPVVGLVYWPPGEGFGYHAWTEVYAGEWLQMDPSWGEELANPSHIALARGDLIAQVSVLHRIMGKMKIGIRDMQQE